MCLPGQGATCLLHLCLCSCKEAKLFFVGLEKLVSLKGNLKLSGKDLRFKNQTQTKAN